MPPPRVTYVLARPTAMAAGGAGGVPSYTGPTAAQQAQAILGPQLAQQNLYAAHQNAVIQSFARSLLGKLQPVAKQVGGDYDQAIQQIGGLSGQAAQYLSGQNPTPMQQALTSSVGAPPEQQAQEAAQLGNVFRGGAGVLAFTGGTIPGSELAGNKAAAQTFARTLPYIGKLSGDQSLASAMWQQSQDRAKLEATRPQLVSDAQSNIDTANYRAASLGQTAASDAEHIREFDLTRSDKVAAAKAKAAAPPTPHYTTVTDSTGTYVVNEDTGARRRVGEGKTPTTSRPRYTTVTDSTGTYIVNEDTGARRRVGEGKQPGAPTPHYTTVTDSTGTYVVNEDTGARRRVGEGKAAATPTPHYTTVSDASGTYVVNEDTGARRRIAGPKVAAPSTSAPSTKTINGVTYMWDAGRRGWVKSGLPVAAAKTPSATAPTTKTINGVTYQWDKGGRGWVPAQGLPTATPKKKTLTPTEAQTEVQRVDDALATMQSGYTSSGTAVKDRTGKTLGPITSRADAMAELEKEGYFSSPALKRLAMARLNKAYPPDIVVRSKGPLGVIATAPPP